MFNDIYLYKIYICVIYHYNVYKCKIIIRLLIKLLVAKNNDHV